MELDPFLAPENVPAKPVVGGNPTTSAPSLSATEGFMDNPSSAASRDGSSPANVGGAGAVSNDSDDPLASLFGTGVEAAATAPADQMPGSSKGVDGGSSLAARQQARAAASPAPRVQVKSPAISSSASRASAAATPTDLNEELASLLLKKQLPQTSVTALQNLLRENASLKEKNNKLKSLLGRSAKAQRDAKNELEQMKKLYESTKVENDRLEKRVEVLANRPTHMDLLADFETNFDRALLSIGSEKNKNQQQSGGENAAESSSGVADVSEGLPSLYDDVTSPSRSSYVGQANNNRSDSLLLTELNEAKSRIAHLESLNESYQGRYNNLEQLHTSLMNDQQSTKNTLTNLQLELRMSRMETEHAVRSLREKDAIVTEMQLEINLVTQSAVDANKRAAEGMEVAQSAKSDREYVDGLEAKVVALQEWALASTESKRLTTERCRGLEGRVNELEEVIQKLTATGGAGEDGLGGSGAFSEGLVADLDNIMPMTRPVNPSSANSLASNQNQERKLWTKSSSLVVGAGMIGHAFLELGKVHIESYETVVLRWKFDLTPGDLDIYFSVLKGIHEDKRKQRGADACFRQRHVKGGGGGDVSGAFAIQNACTLVWSNEMSWVRPRTIKWTVDAVAIEWSD